MVRRIGEDCNQRPVRHHLDKHRRAGAYTGAQPLFLPRRVPHAFVGLLVLYGYVRDGPLDMAGSVHRRRGLGCDGEVRPGVRQFLEDKVRR